ncbi:nuclease SbcCD subunit D [Deltaproteobacteria bacterium]|nr:nuclease SbcCD subunit D [Deltaproteobacteria bacterium]
MRFIHTSDWHLGHQLKDMDRTSEHAAFLAWLIERIHDEAPDALLIAGDVFDRPHPTATAQRAWFQFLLAAHTARPTMAIVVIAGNHDSGARLDAPAELLGHFKVHVVGAVPRLEANALHAAGMLVPVSAPDGTLLARIAAVPYLRPSDLPGGENPDRWVEAIRAIYAAVFAEAPDDGVPLLAMGHSYMVGGSISEGSERKVLNGNLHALPDDIFPAHVAYAALGHLHLPQKVGGRDNVRYSGSPIPLALDERAYKHQIYVVDLVSGAPAVARSVRIPRTVAVPRVPEEGSLSLPEAVAALGAFPAEEPAWIEVFVKLAPGEADALGQLQEVMVNKVAKVLSVRREGGTSTAGAADLTEIASLADLAPEDLLRKKWADHWPDDPLPDEVAALFHEVVDLVEQDKLNSGSAS